MLETASNHVISMANEKYRKASKEFDGDASLYDELSEIQEDLTMHRAKGLEFNTVFIIGCNDEILPGFSKKGPELEEQRRCLYVAMTRAKERLFISCSQIHFINGVLRKMKPSSFLLEAGVKEASTIQFFGNYWYNK